MNIQTISDIDKLSVPEKILLLEDLWDSISSDTDAVPVRDSHKIELDSRLKIHDSKPALSLDELKKITDEL